MHSLLRNLIQFGLRLALITLFIVPAAWAQSVNDATLLGTVTLSTGETLAGATVKITSPVLLGGSRTGTR